MIMDYSVSEDLTSTVSADGKRLPCRYELIVISRIGAQAYKGLLRNYILFLKHSF